MYIEWMLMRLIDIRYTLTHKPRILLLNSSGYDTIAVHMLN
jgi:hypothetical protein